jgi:hypothetical protein
MCIDNDCFLYSKTAGAVKSNILYVFWHTKLLCLNKKAIRWLTPRAYPID